MLRSPYLKRRTLVLRGLGCLSATAALPLLAACGKAMRRVTSATGGGKESQAILAGQRVTTITPAQAPGAALEQVTWLVPAVPLLDKVARERIVPNFQKVQPTVAVSVVAPGKGTTYGQALFALAGAGTIPEVYTDWGGIGFYTLVQQNLLTNLTAYFDQEKVDTSYLPDIYRKEYTFAGKLLAIPWQSNPILLVYNKTLFHKYNVPLPPNDWQDKAWTTEKLLEVAKALTHKTSNPVTMTYGLIMGAGSLGSLGWLWNADPFNDTGGPQDSSIYQGQLPAQVYPDRSGMVEAMKWFVDLRLKYHVLPMPREVQVLARRHGNPFFSGRVGIFEASSLMVRQALFAKPQFQWAFAPFPWGPGGRNTAQREDNAWYLGNGSKNPEEGFHLMLFVTREKGAEDLIDYVKSTPPPRYFSVLPEMAAQRAG
ncbi:MAG: extracellular solute-binding protein [Chloroflexi bacterium]|nr:extracellular solute-binding protein [Chloroflexota bacterium]